MTVDRMTVLSAMMDQGVIPVFYHPDVEVCIKVIQACANGGAKCIEFTNRGDFAAHVFLDVTRHFAKADPSVIMGVGSVVDAPTAGIYIANGAKFVVGPLLNADVAKVCNRRKIPYSPGCGSASEIGYAEELGCEIVKVFPGSSVGGPEFVKAMLGPMPVDPHHADRRRRCRPKSRCPSGSSAGSSPASASARNLITKELLDAKDYAGIEKKVARDHRADQANPGKVSDGRRNPENPSGRRDEVGLRLVRRGDAALRSRLRPRAHRALSSRSGKAAANTMSPAPCANAGASAPTVVTALAGQRSRLAGARISSARAAWTLAHHLARRSTASAATPASA